MPTPVALQEFKQKLKDEYLNLGGSPDRVRLLLPPGHACWTTPLWHADWAGVAQAMGANYFVWISVIIGALALLSWVTGAI